MDYGWWGVSPTEEGTIDSNTPPSSIQLDFNTLAPAVVTDNAILGGNLSTTTTPSAASALNTLVTVFDEDGIPLGLNEGDTIRITSGSYDTVPTGAGFPIDLTASGNLDVLTVTRETTLGDLAQALRTVLRAESTSATMDVTVDSSGRISFQSSSEIIDNLTISAFDPEGAEKTEIRAIFTDGGLDGDLDIAANTITNSQMIRQADATSSTAVFDSQGNSRTVITTFARDTRAVPAVGETLLTELFDDADRSTSITTTDPAATIQIISGTQGATALANNNLLTVTATTTLEELRAAIEGALTDVTVTLLPDGSFQFESTSADAITDLRFGFDPDGAAGATAADETVLTRILNNRGFGIASGTDGLDVAANSTVTTNTFHQEEQINNSWNYQIVVPHDATTPPTAATGRLVFLANGIFENYGLDNDGTLRETNPVIEFDPDGRNPENGGVDALTIQFDFSGITQNAASTTAAIFSQDGSPVGQLETIDISPDGILSGVFTNGSSRALAQILLTTFSNEAGLMRKGDNLFIASSNSGDPVITTPGTLASGEIRSGELELSNVDLSEEFVSLILAQRAFQANARVISTGDQVLQELVNLVR